MGENILISFEIVSVGQLYVFFNINDLTCYKVASSTIPLTL
jgi:hypothetical protein